MVVFVFIMFLSLGVGGTMLSIEFGYQVVATS